jgi:type I restriction enzyme R subunit
MNVNNFIVRPKRRLVEQYRDPKAWEKLELEQQSELAREVAGLPSELVDEDQEAKQFDLLMLRLQLALLRSEPAFVRLRKEVQEIAELLEEKDSIPMVRAQMPVIQEVQTDEFWQDVTAPMLENVRKRLRQLVKLIEKSKRPKLYTDFEDVIGDETTLELPGFGAGVDFERFRAKVREFLKAHENEGPIYKLRWNEPLTPGDLERLERMLVEAGAGTTGDIERARKESSGLGLFLRSLIGLDRDAAKRAFEGFLVGKAATANQIEFINLIIDHLTQRGWMDPALLYESPFTDFSPRGVEGLFGPAQVTALISTLDTIRQSAVA